MDWNPIWADAIANNESGGRYDLLGPVTRSGDRAYGKFQVMGNNVGPWTEAALGKAMSPQEFLADPAAQEAVFKHRFGGYVDKYGNPQDAASAWFSGRPLAKAGNSSDILGTTVPAYVGKFDAYLNKAPSVSNNTPASPAAAPSAPLQLSQQPIFPQQAAPQQQPLQQPTAAPQFAGSPQMSAPQMQPYFGPQQQRRQVDLSKLRAQLQAPIFRG